MMRPVVLMVISSLKFVVTWVVPGIHFPCDSSYLLSISTIFVPGFQNLSFLFHHFDLHR